MPKARRSRLIAAPTALASGGSSPIRTTCARWWPKVARVEAVQERKRGTGTLWTKVLADRGGRDRAGRLSLPLLEGAERIRVGAGDRGLALREGPALVRDGHRAERQRRAARSSRSRPQQRPARHVAVRRAFMLKRATGTQLDEALDGLERALCRATETRARAAWLSREPMKWWGWGDPERTAAAAAARRSTRLRDRRSAPERGAPTRCRSTTVELERLDLSEQGRASGSRAPSVTESVRDDRASRASCHAAGKGYPDLVRMRSGSAGEGSRRRRAIRRPKTRCEPCSSCAASTASPSCRSAAAPAWWAASSRSATASTALIALDLARMTAVSAVDARSLTADARRRPSRAAGGERARRVGTSRSATSRSRSSTRPSAAGSRPGPPARPRPATARSRRWSSGSRCVTPAGAIESRPLPASAAGPQLRELLVGSEGVLGVITSATLRVRPRPAAAPLRGLDVQEASPRERRRSASSSRQGAAPEVARLSDEIETLLSLQLAGGKRLARAACGSRYVKARGYDGGCLAILGFEGDRTDVARRRAQAARILRSAGGLALGTRPGTAWERGRFDAPYLRDALLDNCVMVETLETAGAVVGPDGPVCGGRAGAPQDARGARHAAACDVPRIAPVSERRFALLHLLRGAGARARARAVAGRQVGRDRRDPRRRWNDHPSPRDRHGTMRAWLPREIGDGRRRICSAPRSSVSIRPAS